MGEAKARGCLWLRNQYLVWPQLTVVLVSLHMWPSTCHPGTMAGSGSPLSGGSVDSAPDSPGPSGFTYTTRKRGKPEKDVCWPLGVVTLFLPHMLSAFSEGNFVEQSTP